MDKIGNFVKDGVNAYFGEVPPCFETISRRTTIDVERLKKIYENSEFPTVIEFELLLEYKPEKRNNKYCESALCHLQETSLAKIIYDIQKNIEILKRSTIKNQSE